MIFIFLKVRNPWIVCLYCNNIILVMQIRRKSMNVEKAQQSVDSKFKIFTVSQECNMIDFAKEKIDKYDPDSGYGYYQFLDAEEYISPKTQVVLVNEVGIHKIIIYNKDFILILNLYIMQGKNRKCTGRKARNIIGVTDKREMIKLPDLSGTEWKYVFIQSTSRIKTLPEDSLFMYCKYMRVTHQNYNYQ